MGQSNSIEYDYNSQKLPWKSLFSPKIISFIKKELEHQHPQAESTEGQTVDFVPLSTVLENIISTQRLDGEALRLPPDFSSTFFRPIIRDIDVHFDQARNFSKYFESIRTLANTIMDREQQKRNDNISTACTKFAQISQPKKGTTGFIEDFITIALENLLPYVHLLSVNDVIAHLNNLNKILKDEKNNSLASVNSSSITSINKFITAISQIDEFKVPEVQKETIDFLYNMSHVQGSVCGCLSALIYMLDLPEDLLLPVTKPLLINTRSKFSAPQSVTSSAAQSSGNLQQSHLVPQSSDQGLTASQASSTESASGLNLNINLSSTNQNASDQSNQTTTSESSTSQIQQVNIPQPSRPPPQLRRQIRPKQSPMLARTPSTPMLPMMIPLVNQDEPENNSQQSLQQGSVLSPNTQLTPPLAQTPNQQIPVNRPRAPVPLPPSIAAPAPAPPPPPPSSSTNEESEKPPETKIPENASLSDLLAATPPIHLGQNKGFGQPIQVQATSLSQLLASANQNQNQNPNQATGLPPPAPQGFGTSSGHAPIQPSVHRPAPIPRPSRRGQRVALTPNPVPVCINLRDLGRSVNQANEANINNTSTASINDSGELTNANQNINLSSLPSTNLANLTNLNQQQSNLILNSLSTTSIISAQGSISAIPSTSSLNVSATPTKRKNSHIFELPTNDIKNVVSFSIGSNVLVLSSENKLAVFFKPIVFMINVSVSEDSILFDAYDFIYIFSQSQNTIQIINVEELEAIMEDKQIALGQEANISDIPFLTIDSYTITSENDLIEGDHTSKLQIEVCKMSDFINLDYKIVSVGNISNNYQYGLNDAYKYITIVQAVDENNILCSVFLRNIKTNNCNPECRIPLETIITPEHFYFDETRLHVVDKDMIDVPYVIFNSNDNENSNTPTFKIQQDPATFCPYVFIDKAPMVCYKNYFYTIANSFEKLVFVKYETPLIPMDDEDTEYSRSAVYIKKFPFQFSPVIIPAGDGNNFQDSLKQVCNSLTVSIDLLLQKCFENVSVISNRFVSYFVSNGNTSIDLSMKLVNNVINATTINDDQKMALIALGIKIIALNLHIYCLKYAKSMENFTDEDDEFFKKVKKVIRHAIYSKYAKRSPAIIEAVCAVFFLSYRFLYYPSYKEFATVVKMILDDKILRNYFLMNYILISHSPCSLYIHSSSMFQFVQETIDKKTIFKAFSNSLDTLTDEFHFLTVNSVKTNEGYMIPFFKNLLQFLSDNLLSNEDPTSIGNLSINVNGIRDNGDINGKYAIKLAQKINFRLMCLDTFPLISSTVVSYSIPIMSSVTQKFLNDPDICKIDDENLKIKMTDNKDVKTFIVESEHNYSHGAKNNYTIDFTGCSAIHLDFDPRCQTDPTNDTLYIYSRNNILLYKYSGNNWPKELDIQADYLIFKFESNSTASNSLWGYKVVCKPIRTSDKKSEFRPNSTLFFFDMFFNTLGRLTNVALASLPPSQMESQCKLILESDILQGLDGMSKLIEQEDQKTSNKRNLTRGLSRGLSFDASNAGLQYSDELKKGFLNDLISPTPMENGWAGKLLQFMYKAVKNQHRIKPPPEILEAEKYAIAAFLKQLGFINVAISFAMSLGTSDPKDVTVPPNLNTTWKAIYKLRTTLYMSYQNSKRNKVVDASSFSQTPKISSSISNFNSDNNNNTGGTGGNAKEGQIGLSSIRSSSSLFTSSHQLLPLRDNYPAYLEDVKMKCKLLLYNDPILKKRFGDSEVYNSKTIETTIYELLSFISSDLQMENISRMVDIRTSRMKTRLSGLKSIINIVQNKNFLRTSQIAFLEPLDQSLSLLTNLTDVKSVKADLLDELFGSFSQLFELLVSRITDDEENILHRLLFLKLIAVDVEGIITPTILTQNFMKVSSFAEKCPTTPIESYVTLSCLWRILGIWSIQTPQKEIIESLLHFTSIQSNEICKDNAILLLSVLSQSSDFVVSNFEPICNCFLSSNPRVVIATLIWLSKTLTRKNSSLKEEDFKVTIRNQNYNFKSFLHLLLKSCGYALCTGTSYLIPDESLPESHKMIAEEIIAFFRVIIKPFSIVRETVVNTVHEVFNENSSCDLLSATKSNLEENQKQADQHEVDSVHELIAVFAILGKETIPFRSTGFAIQHSKSQSELSRILLYERYSSRLVFLNHEGVEQTAVRESISTYVPSANISANPNDFTINVDEAKLINSIQKIIIESFNNMKSIDFAVLAANFIGFLTVSLQNQDNMKTFIENIEIERFYTCALKQMHDSNPYYSIGNLIDQIGTASIDISTLMSIENKIKNKLKNKAKSRSQYNENDDGRFINSFNSSLPYSLVFLHVSTHCFIPLTFGTIIKQIVNKNNGAQIELKETSSRGLGPNQEEVIAVSSIPKKKCIFVGDQAMPNTTLFYFEIKIISHSNNDFQVGLIDQRSKSSAISFYGFDFGKSQQCSLFLHFQKTETIEIENGDVIGCGYTRNEIVFFKNGQSLKKSIPYPLIDDFVPAVITDNCELKFTYNFGKDKFVTEIVKFPEFDIKSDCLENFDVPVPENETKAPKETTISLDDPDYDEFVSKNEALWEIARPYPTPLLPSLSSLDMSKIEKEKKEKESQDEANGDIKESETLIFNDSTSRFFPHLVYAHNISTPPKTVFNISSDSLFKTSFLIGQPVHIARRNLPKNSNGDEKESDKNQEEPAAEVDNESNDANSSMNSDSGSGSNSDSGTNSDSAMVTAIELAENEEAILEAANQQQNSDEAIQLQGENESNESNQQDSQQSTETTNEQQQQEAPLQPPSTTEQIAAAASATTASTSTEQQQQQQGTTGEPTLKGDAQSSEELQIGIDDSEFLFGNDKKQMLSSDAQYFINRYGIIVDITPIPGKEYVNLTLEVFDYMKQERTRFQIDSRFVDPITTQFFNVVESAANIFTQTAAKAPITTAMLLRSSSKSSNDNTTNSTMQFTNAKTAQALSEETAECVTNSILSKQMNRLYETTKNLIVRMCRILFVIVLDFYRSQNKVPSVFNESQHPQSVEVFALAILEVFKFVHSPKVSEKWKVTRISDLIFGEKDHTSNAFDISYFCPCNKHAFVRCIRAIFYRSPKEMQPVISSLLKFSIEHIMKAPKSTREQIFTLIPNRFVIETPHPMPQVNLNIHFELPESITGFIPILHPLHNTQEQILYIAKHPIKDALSDCSVFPANEYSIQFTNQSAESGYGLKFGILLLNDYLQDYMFMTPLKGIHILATLLSVVLSSPDLFVDATKILKQELIPGIAQLMNKSNFFIDLFSFDFIAPILTTFQWTAEDITPRIESAFQCFTSNFQTSIHEWTKLTLNSQQAIVMTVFTRLLTLDASAARITSNSPPEDIAHLYDTYVNTKVKENASVFEKMIEAISLCCALGFDMPISVRFPAFLIAESWAESIPYSIELETKPGCTSIVNYSFDQFKKGEIEFVKDDSLPPNTCLHVSCDRPKDEENTTNNELTSFNLMPGKTGNVTSPFSIQLCNAETLTKIESIESTQTIKIVIRAHPESHQAKREKFVANYSAFKQHVDFMSNHWQVKMDESLSRIAKGIPKIFDMCPLIIDHPLFDAETILARIPAQLLRCRLQLFLRLNSYVPKIVKIVEFGNQETLLGKIFTSCRAAISTEFKLDTVKKSVMKDLASGTSPEIKFNRFKAQFFYSKPSNPQGLSLLSQLISQIPISQLTSLKRQNVPWHVDLVGEGATDVGGPGRDLFTEACMELMHPSLGLFIANPNKRVNSSNVDQELLIPNPSPLTETTKMQYFYAGVLMSLCYISQIPEPFRFARFVWNFLTNRQVTIDDIYEVDNQFQTLMQSIEDCEKTISDPEQFQAIFPLFFDVQNSLGEVVELIPGGSSIPVTFERRNEYIQRCQVFRIKEFNTQLEELRKGFNYFFPSSAATILAPWELELLICGDNQCPVSEMKKNFQYSSEESHIDMLWSVLEEFTPKERMLFIKFGCGRMGLPPPGMFWPQKLSIQFKTVNDSDPLKPLPTAATCSSQMTIPRYDTKEWMAKKIRAAITLGADIDQDRNANIRDLQDVT